MLGANSLQPHGEQGELQVASGALLLRTPPGQPTCSSPEPLLYAAWLLRVKKFHPSRLAFCVFAHLVFLLKNTAPFPQET